VRQLPAAVVGFGDHPANRHLAEAARGREAWPRPRKPTAFESDARSRFKPLVDLHWSGLLGFSGMWLEVVKEAHPPARRVAILLSPGNPINAPVMRATEIAAKPLGLELLSFETRRSDELRSTFSRMSDAGIDAVGVTDDTHFVGNAGVIAELAISNRLPSIGFTEFAPAGGLIGYGVNLGDLWYRGAFFIDRILKGTRPADLPVEQPIKFELMINLKTAKALGLEIPPTLLTRADEVIE
jgi:putative tryptophan/tyrosine transport system substrate-binding protein